MLTKTTIAVINGACNTYVCSYDASKVQPNHNNYKRIFCYIEKG